jgi:hypothetical protein
MITRQLSRRVRRIEERVRPKDASGFTLEELCRAMWRSNPAQCVQISQELGEYTFRSFIPRFEAEDARRSA